jgi:hypothetical protein
MSMNLRVSSAIYSCGMSSSFLVALLSFCSFASWLGLTATMVPFSSFVTAAAPLMDASYFYFLAFRV